MNRAWWIALALAPAALHPRAVAAQDSAMSRAFELERRGNYAQAVEAYRAVLATRPADAPAMLGLERSLTPLGRTTEILPQVRAALAVLRPSNTSGAVFGVALRAWAAAGVPDSLRAVAERWAAMARRRWASGTGRAPGRRIGAPGNSCTDQTRWLPKSRNSTSPTATSKAPSASGCRRSAGCRGIG